MTVRHAAYDHLRPAAPVGAAGQLLPHALTWLLLLVLAGCGALPRPFEPEDKTGNRLLAPIEGQTLEVLPLEGAVPPLPDGGAALIAEGLAAGGLPATAGQRTAQSRLLLGIVGVTEGPGGGELVVVDWEVHAPGGSLLGRYGQETELPRGAWLAGDPDSLRLVGLDAGPVLAQIAGGPELVPESGVAVEAADGGRPRLAFAGVKGAPGDGNSSLARALSSVLTQRGYLVVQQPLAGDLVVSGEVAVVPAGEGQEAVTLTWRLLDGPRGGQLGEVQQGNVIRAGSLNRGWGDVAAVIAVAAADGITDLLQQAGKL